MTAAMTEPRAGSVVLGGHAWLARMIDKARLEAAGIIDDFDLEYPCPMDQQLLKKLHMDGKTFQAIAVNNPADADILQALGLAS